MKKGANRRLWQSHLIVSIPVHDLASIKQLVIPVLIPFPAIISGARKNAGYKPGALKMPVKKR
jgi:hypothetical protein